MARIFKSGFKRKLKRKRNRIFPAKQITVPRFEALENRKLLAVVTVDTAEDIVDPNDGLISLREAIISTNESAGADEIKFAESLAGSFFNLNHGAFDIKDELSIMGLGDDQTIIDAGENSRIFSISSSDQDFHLQGLGLTGGRTLNVSGSGGAIFHLSTGLLTINDSKIWGNSTKEDHASGGGVFARGDVSLNNSIISENFTEGRFANGGGIFTLGEISLSDGTIIENYTSGEDAHGGGIFSDSVVMLDSEISSNSTQGEGSDGGGIFSTNISLINSTISDNSTDGDLSGGGGIASIGGHVGLLRSTIFGNTTSGEIAFGGGIWAIGDVSLMSSTISENSTAGENSLGGGIWATNIILKNSTISGNFTTGDDADVGGVSSGGDLTISSSIIAGNTVSGMLSQSPDVKFGNPFSNLIVNNSLIGDKDNSTLLGSPPLVEAQTPDANGNLIGSSTGSGIIDPLLGPLQDNGGPTQTHALLPASPAIDSGINPENLEFDQRGDPFIRVFGEASDMGSYEFQDIIGDSNRDGRFNVFDILQVLVAGKYSTGEEATFEEGDWNGDSLFNVFDIILALTEGNFEGSSEPATLIEENPLKASAETVDQVHMQHDPLDMDLLESVELIAVGRRM